MQLYVEHTNQMGSGCHVVFKFQGSTVSFGGRASSGTYPKDRVHNAQKTGNATSVYRSGLHRVKQLFVASPPITVRINLSVSLTQSRL